MMKCATIGCHGTVSYVMTYRYRGESEIDQDAVCGECMLSYERRPAVAVVSVMPAAEVNGQLRVMLRVGDTVRLTMPWSEVCMHMKVADKTMPVRVKIDAAQLLNDDGLDYCGPILLGEAGIYQNYAGQYPDVEAGGMFAYLQV